VHRSEFHSHYIPTKKTGKQVTGVNPIVYWGLLVRLERFELPTLGSVDRCSNPLSYSRIVVG
jgi:hypothetical protein